MNDFVAFARANQERNCDHCGKVYVTWRGWETWTFGGWGMAERVLTCSQVCAKAITMTRLGPWWQHE